MKSKVWVNVFWICILAVLLTNLPFLPGPPFLYYPAQLFYSVGMLFGLVGLVLVPIGMAWTINEYQKHPVPRKNRLFSILCWTLPLAIFFSTLWLSEYTRAFSREFAIDRASILIKQIEQHKSEEGSYPEVLSELSSGIPSSYIIGIPTYFYEKTEVAYTLSFTQNVIFNFNFEVVLYDPTGSHKAEGELSDLYDAGEKNWKYYIYD